jgi:hypothetical protein
MPSTFCTPLGVKRMPVSMEEPQNLV